MNCICSLCKEEKDISLFKKDKRRDNGITSQCKDCLRIKSNEYYHNTKDMRRDKLCENRRESYNRNKDRENLKSKEYKSNNRDKRKNLAKKYKDENIDKRKNLAKKYKDENIDRIREYNRSYFNFRLKNDDMFRLSHNIKNSIRKCLRMKGYSKTSKTIDIIGCSYIELRNHIESKFEDWMTWDNYGKYNGEFNYGWDIDHIIPLSSSRTVEELINLNHYTNLQPLCSKVNRDIKRSQMNY